MATCEILVTNIIYHGICGPKRKIGFMSSSICQIKCGLISIVSLSALRQNFFFLQSDLGGSGPKYLLAQICQMKVHCNRLIGSKIKVLKTVQQSNIWDLG